VDAALDAGLLGVPHVDDDQLAVSIGAGGFRDENVGAAISMRDGTKLTGGATPRSTLDRTGGAKGSRARSRTSSRSCL
jgi:hypothetical protein